MQLKGTPKVQNVQRVPLISTQTLFYKSKQQNESFKGRNTQEKVNF